MRHLIAAAAAAAVAAQQQRVEHVIVIQFENRAFDHLLGWADIPGMNGLTGKEYNLMNPLQPESPSNPAVFVGQNAQDVSPDPLHCWECIEQQLHGSCCNHTMEAPNMSGFLASAVAELGPTIAPQIMQSFSPQHVPVLTTLASEFTLIDGWHAEPLPTFPNRLFTLSASSYGYAANDKLRTLLGFPQDPIFKQLDQANTTWRVYSGDAPTPLIFQYTRQPSVLFSGKFRGMDKFYTDVAAGDLPSFTWIDPLYFDSSTAKANDQHASHDVLQGELLMKSVYESLRASPVWNKTALIITYDEHGGFYDHVAPPVTGIPSPDGRACVDCNSTYTFNTLGVRVPTVIVSPWAAKTVVHAPEPAFMPTPTSAFEHSSIPATLHEIFKTPSFLNARDAWAAPMHYLWENSAMTEPRTDCPTTLPVPPPTSPAFVGKAQTGQRPLNDLQEGLLVLAHGAFGTADSLQGMDAANAELGLATEAAAGDFIRANMEKIWTLVDEM